MFLGIFFFYVCLLREKCDIFYLFSFWLEVGDIKVYEIFERVYKFRGEREILINICMK